jgi:hypothetical protein
MSNINFSIKGTVVNNNLTPLVNVKISDTIGHKTLTDKNGIFTLNGNTNVSQSISIDVDFQGYSSQTLNPYLGNNEFKSDLGVIVLQSTKSELSSDKITASQITEKQIDVLSKDKKDFKYHSQKKLNESLNNLKNLLLPAILALIAEFGVTKVNDIISKNSEEIQNIIQNKTYCPSQAQLTDIINRKNKLVKQLNNTFKLIDSTTKALGITEGTIEALNLAYQILKNLPVPSAVAGVGLPISIINNVQDSKDRLDKLITGLRSLTIGSLTVLSLLKDVLTQVINFLNLLDKLVQFCYPDAEQETISAELTALTSQQSNQLSPIVTNVNGFEMGVETERTTNTLKRRRAIARNKGGVIMLQGEWSFSSVDQILIDELVFYIQQNDLKAE